MTTEKNLAEEVVVERTFNAPIDPALFKRPSP